MSEKLTPRVSIIIPTCDRSAMTRRCLDALAVQSYEDIEIVVVDDGSQDDTPAMLEQFRAEHPNLRLIVLRNERNLGANASRNRGVQASTGEMIAFLDSDCIASVDWIENLLPCFEDKQIGAVTGLVLDPPPRNIYDLTFRGTHRLAQAGPARRLVAGNLCVRREPLMASMWCEDSELPPPKADGQPDVAFSGACDEEGLTIRLQESGWKIWACPKAVVLHEHYYNRKSFFRQAYHGGRAAADLVHRYRLRHRTDMAPFILAWGSLPIGAALTIFLGAWPLAIPGLFFILALVAITYNDLVLKGKTVIQTVRSLPMLVIYYHVRLFGYVQMTLILHAHARKKSTSNS